MFSFCYVARFKIKSLHGDVTQVNVVTIARTLESMKPPAAIYTSTETQSSSLEHFLLGGLIKVNG